MSGHVFISYSRADLAYVEKLATFLEAAGIPCWYDHELAAGDRWGRVIRAEIDRCAAFVVVMTPAAEESKWVSRELARADGRKPIFPLLLAGEPFFELSEVQFEDVTGERLPGASIVNRLRSLVTVDSAPASPPPPIVWPAAPRVSGRLLHTLTGHTHEWVGFVVWSPDGTRLATACGDMTSRIWDAAIGTMLHTLTGHLQPVSRCTWSPDGARLATTSTDSTVRVWNSITGASVHTLNSSTVQVTKDLLASREASERERRERANQIFATIEYAYWVAWSPDGTRLVTATGHGTARIWDVATGTGLHTLIGHAAPVHQVAWSPEGTRLATTCFDYDDETCRIWDPATGTTVHVVDGGQIAWSPDGALLAIARGETVRIWDPVNGAELYAFSGHTRVVMSIAWSPDGTRLATASQDATARIWEIVPSPESAR